MAICCAPRAVAPVRRIKRMALRWVHAVLPDDGHRARQGEVFHQFLRGIRLLDHGRQSSRADDGLVEAGGQCPDNVKCQG